MGTRSLTYVVDAGLATYASNEDAIICCIYRQYDGYPTGHGMELAEFLQGMEVVNGYSSKRPKLANGMGCLAAQLVAHLKNGVEGTVGNIYLTTPEEFKDSGQEYEYWIGLNWVRVLENYPDRQEIFNGSWDAFKVWCSKWEDC